MKFPILLDSVEIYIATSKNQCLYTTTYVKTVTIKHKYILFSASKTAICIDVIFELFERFISFHFQ